jgi:hypothetical protein
MRHRELLYVDGVCKVCGRPMTVGRLTRVEEREVGLGRPELCIRCVVRALFVVALGIHGHVDGRGWTDGRG